MAEVLDGIDASEEWKRRQVSDPLIQKTEARLRKVLERVRKIVEENDYEELSESISAEVSAYCDSAILFGFFTAGELWRMAVHPDVVQREYIARMVVKE